MFKNITLLSPESWRPSDYYASHYVDLTDTVELDDTPFFDPFVFYKATRLGVTWYADLDIYATHDEPDEMQYAGGYYRIGLARGWDQRRTDVMSEIPNFDPDVLMSYEYEEWQEHDRHCVDGDCECELYWQSDHRIYVREKFLLLPDLLQLKNAWIKSRLGREL